MSWLSGYTCQKKCTVVATAAGAQTNYQLELKVGESSGAAGEDVDCENCCEDFPNDIRFTKEDGETKHDYWIESVTGTTPNQLATIIIEIASVPISGSVDFYMYYGKSGDSGESDGDNTFVFFGDFIGNTSEKTNLDTFTEIGLYESSNPVIACGGISDSDRYIREIGNVLYESGEASRKYKTFYTGYNVGASTDEKIHYAYSEDGKSWTKSSANPVVSNRRAEDPYVVKNGSTYYLFAEDKEAGGENKIRRWHSSDCETWVDDGQITGIGDGQSPIVWIEGSTWYILYERYPANCDIALATSANGLAWTDDPSNPVMEKTDTNWVTGSIVPDDIIKKGSTYYMTYHGQDGAVWKIGIATSTNLTTWTDSPNSPFSSDESGFVSIYVASIFYDTEDVFLYYGDDGGPTDTGGIFRGYPIKAKWTEETNGGTASISFANSKVRLQATDSGHYANLYSAPISASPCALRIKGLDVDGIGNVQLKLNKDGAYPTQNDAALFALWDLTVGGGGNSDIAGYIKYGAGPLSEETWRDLNVGDTYDKTKLALLIASDRKVKWEIEGTSKGVSTNSVDDETWRIQLMAVGGRGATDMYVDAVMLCNYASPEPTWGSWGVANKEIHSPDVGTGTDIALGVQGALLGTDVGAGVDAILAALSARLEADVGAGVDVLVELLKVIAKYDSDVGVGIDTDIEYRHGSGSLAGSEGVAVMHNLNIVNYQPEIYVAEESGAIGEIWITDIGTNSFVVRNSGDAKISFDWVIYAGEIAPGYNGSGNLAGTSGITIAHNLGVANYLPAICITEESGAIGEIWITDIGTNSFVVRNSGDAEVSFNWVICETDVEADHRGNANLAGTSGVTIAHNLDLAFYQFQLAVTEESGAIGEIWITDIGTNSFVVRNSGDARVAFSWVIYDITRSDILATLFEAETGIGIDELSCLLGSLENAEIGSGLEEAKLILTSSDLGIGIDELCSLLGNLENADVGAGADAISEILGMLQEADGGSGLEEAKLILTSSDVGVGIDELASLLGTISDSDLGSGIEAEIKVVWIYLMLKLLQEKKLNIKLSQGDES